MRRLALTALCVTPSLLFAACGDNTLPASPGEDDPELEDIDVQEAGYPDPGAREIRAALDITSPSCDAATAGFEALVRYADDGSFVPNVRCKVVFDDGATSDQCVGEHTFATPGPHGFVLEAVDVDTGATVRHQVTRTIDTPLEVELELDVPACGLEVGFQAKLSTGALVITTLAPVDQVEESVVFGPTGRFVARAPGTYTLRLQAEDERPVGPICNREVTRTVELRACPDPEPDC